MSQFGSGAIGVVKKESIVSKSEKRLSQRRIKGSIVTCLIANSMGPELLAYLSAWRARKQLKGRIQLY